MAIIMAMFGHCMVKFDLNSWLNILIDFPASDWYNKIPISLFQTSKLDIFMISGFPTHMGWYGGLPCI